MARFDPSSMQAFLRGREARQVLVTYLNLLSSRLRVVALLQRQYAGITYVDTIVNLHVFAFRDGGTRQQHLIDSLGIPRRTIRDSLVRLERFDLIVREGALYYPSDTTARLANEMLGEVFANVGLLCDSVNDYRQNRGRHTP
jgi:predicted transcriptional regulator